MRAVREAQMLKIGERPLRVALVIDNGWRGDYAELRRFFERLIRNLVAITPVSPSPGGASFDRKLRKHWRCVPVATLVKLAWEIFRRSLTGRGDDVTSLAQSMPDLRSKILEASSVNDESYLAELRKTDPDVIVSYGCPQIFKKRLLDLPKLGCVNVHPGELPRFRGPSPLFYALLEGERHVTVTIHVMEPGIDDGLVIGAQILPVDPSTDTLWDLGTRRVPAAALPLLEEVLTRISRGEVRLDESRPVGAGNYRSWPDADDLRQFFARRRRLV
jgi:methionyl-tRNA formyltransferase